MISSARLAITSLAFMLTDVPAPPCTMVYADGSYQMSILKSADGNGDSVQRYFFDQQVQRKCEDNYAFDLFIRSQHPDALSEEEWLEIGRASCRERV